MTREQVLRGEADLVITELMEAYDAGRISYEELCFGKDLAVKQMQEKLRGGENE